MVAPYAPGRCVWFQVSDHSDRNSTARLGKSSAHVVITLFEEESLPRDHFCTSMFVSRLCYPSLYHFFEAVEGLLMVIGLGSR